MKLKLFSIPVLAFLIISVLSVSCKDEWDAHYSSKVTTKSDSNLYDYIQSRSDLSIFAEMIQVAGYDTILNQNQTFTVWAPTNSALEGLDLSNTDLVIKLVKNHITRFSNITSGVNKKTILMMNSKFLEFARSASGYTFGGMQIIEPDIATANGILHVMGEYVPYKKNIWEFIREENGLDSLKNFINSLTDSVFDPSKSFKDEVLVDSVFKKTNYVFDYLAQIGVEDSIYTAILPNNTAWVEAFNRIKPYYRVLPEEGGEKMQNILSKQFIINDVFFKNRVTLPINKDTLIATSGTEFVNPNRLFENSQKIEMSNGLGYITGQMKNTAYDSWYKTIKIEAENSYYGRTVSNFAPSTISSIGSGYNVSGGRYLNLFPTTSSRISVLFAIFPIPMTLSAKYDIYCVYVPTKIVDQNDLKPYKVKYYLSYVNELGKQVTNHGISSSNTLSTSASSAAEFITNPNKLDTMLVLKNFQFPYSNMVYNQIDPIKSISVSLKVQNTTGVATTDLENYNRNIRIDCIILKPVQE